MAKRRTSAKGEEALDKVARALERGRFADYVDQLQDTRTLLWRNLLIGLMRGFGAIVGATVVVALVVAILGLLGESLPGAVGEFFRETGERIQPNP